MVDPSEGNRFEELAAGYVLGDLDSEEMAEFQQLAIKHPSLWEKVAGLQETLNLLPFTLSERHPHPSVRAHIMHAAETKSAQKSSRAATQSHQTAISQLSWTTVFGSIAAVTTIALGLQTLHFNQQLAQVQRKLDQQKSKVVALQHVTSPSTPRNVLITTTDTFVHSNWLGVEQILVDHRQATEKGLQAIDIATNQPTQLVALLKPQVPMPSAMPVLSQVSAKLLGGSICQFGKAKGVRITYDTNQHRQVSFYQIARSQKPALPQLTPEKLYLAIQDGPSGVFWSDGEFLYAIVSNLPADDLKKLTSAVEIAEI